MSDALTVPKGERHVVRVFALDMTSAEVRSLRNLPPVPAQPSVDPALRHADPAVVAALFGLQTIDAGYVEILDTADFTEFRLARYLIEGTAVAEAQIAADRDRLDRQQGYVLVVFSRAFGDRAATLRPVSKLSLIGAYAEDVQPVRFEPLPDASAQGVIPGGKARTPMSDARVSGLVAMVALAVMFALVAAVVWMAG